VQYIFSSGSKMDAVQSLASPWTDTSSTHMLPVLCTTAGQLSSPALLKAAMQLQPSSGLTGAP
jgi:hypothetical protein